MSSDQLRNITGSDMLGNQLGSQLFSRAPFFDQHMLDAQQPIMGPDGFPLGHSMKIPGQVSPLMTPGGNK